MSKIMVAKGDVTTIHHAGKVYTRGKGGEFVVEDAHVDALRPHGLRLKAEVDAEAKNANKDVEIAALKKRLAELEGEKKAKKD